MSENLTDLTVPAPAEGNVETLENDTVDTAPSPLDALTRDLTAVDLEVPLFPDGAHVVFDVKEGTIEQTKETNEPILVFKLATVNVEKATKNRTFQPGRTFKHRINLGTTSKKGDDITEIRDRNLKQFRVACGLPKDGAFGHPTNYVGKRCVAVMGIEKGTGPFGDQNRISKFVLPGAPKPITASASSL